MSRVVAALLLLLGPASAGLECTLCKSAMEKVDESVLDVNATAVVESTCEKVPDILGARAKCVEEASAAVDDILNKTVATALDPETACECLGACDGGDRARAAVGSIECALCEAAVEATDAVLKLNATQAALEKLADEACEALGPLGRLRPVLGLDGVELRLARRVALRGELLELLGRRVEARARLHVAGEEQRARELLIRRWARRVIWRAVVEAPRRQRCVAIVEARRRESALAGLHDG